MSGLCILFLSTMLLAQGSKYDGPEDPAGDISAERTGYMNGNRILLYYENNTQLADYPRINTSRWPNNYKGCRMIDVISVLIGGEVYITADSISVQDFDRVAQLAETGQIDTLFYIQSSGFAPLNMDTNYDNTVEWGFYPVPGYFNETQDYPAMSNKPDSWPVEGWPSAGREKKWPGEWNGRFGRGIKYADLESYFVANDAQDMEYIIRRNDPEERVRTDSIRYFPRPGVFIGDVNPDVTVQKGYPWGGLGLRVAVRGFQWNNPEAKDIIFWEYNISNISEYDLIKCGFGYFVDNSIGGDTGGDKEEGYFNDVLDLCYVWEKLGVGQGGVIPGVSGMAYLESPGKAFDNIDNDSDGLNDEKRDNLAGQLIGPTDGIEDMQKFLSFYHYKEEDLHDHYAGDEDQDWDDGYDANENGVYGYQAKDGSWMLEPGEYAGDDVGLDGVGPMDLNYNGPDEGECNHRPDFVEGVGCEPDFAAVDISEADMLGLTAFKMFDWPQWQDLNYMLGEDKAMWSLMDSHNLDSGVFRSGGPGSVYEVFASTPFPFYKGQTERISMGIMFCYENLSNLSTGDHEAPNMFRLKETAQVIYERDYRFAQPPLMPTLKAIPGDGKVILTWDDIADKKTREPFMQNENDFEGYKLYRATDKHFSDAEVITDGQGNRMRKKPIFQCDVIDKKMGYAEYGLVEGTAFYLGDDTGIKHHYIDTDVQNGVTYYYALVAYDYGIEEFGVSPTENNIVIELDESESIVRMGKNVQAVMPRQKAAGYIPPSIKIDEQRTTKSLKHGAVIPSIIDNSATKPHHTYKVSFQIDTLDHYQSSERRRHPMDFKYRTNGFNVYDITQGEELVYTENPTDGFPSDNLLYDKDSDAWMINTQRAISSDLFDGIQLEIMAKDSAVVDFENTGWITGSSYMNVNFGSNFQYFPWDYEIVFTGDDSSYSTKASTLRLITDENGNPINRDSLVMDQSYNFYVLNKSSVDSTGSYEKCDLVCYDKNVNGIFDWDMDQVLVGHPIEYRNRIYMPGTAFTIDFNGVSDESQLPKANDVYQINVQRPFSSVDNFVFTVQPEVKSNRDAIKTEMDSIKVVPNPYIATNAMEPAVGNKFLNQRRRILFTHIPAKCTIRIFTSSGILVDELNVENKPSDGIVHWDVLSREGLEIAAGMYIYQAVSKETGYKKMGKFAVIK